MTRAVHVPTETVDKHTVRHWSAGSEVASCKMCEQRWTGPDAEVRAREHTEATGHNTEVQRWVEVDYLADDGAGVCQSIPGVPASVFEESDVRLSAAEAYGVLRALGLRAPPVLACEMALCLHTIAVGGRSCVALINRGEYSMREQPS